MKVGTRRSEALDTASGTNHKLKNQKPKIKNQDSRITKTLNLCLKLSSSEKRRKQEMIITPIRTFKAAKYRKPRTGFLPVVRVYKALREVAIKQTPAGELLFMINAKEGRWKESWRSADKYGNDIRLTIARKAHLQEAVKELEAIIKKEKEEFF